MKLRSFLPVIALTMSTLCIAGGYLSAGNIMVLPGMVAMALVWVIVKRSSGFWAASTLFAGYLALAGIGVVDGLSLDLMLAGSIAALAAWDLMRFDLDSSQTPEAKASAKMGRHRLQLLVITLSMGWLSAGLAARIHLSLPFFAILFLAVVAILSLNISLQKLAGRHL